MCGPLACAGLPPSGAERRTAAVAWHLGRVTAYTAVGVLLGLIGQGVTRTLSLSVQPYLPWVMALGLVITALDLGKHLKPLPGIARVSRALARAGAKLSPAGRAFALGAATPFLPCGLLYGIFLAAVATGSALGGAAVMGAFSLGAIPLLAGVQAGAKAWSRWPNASAILRRAVPLTAAFILIARALMTKSDPRCD